MQEEKYVPVSCDYHDQLEAAAIHKSEVELHVNGGDGFRTLRGRIEDVFTADGAEYVRFLSAEGAKKIRLDQIAGFREIGRVGGS